MIETETKVLRKKHYYTPEKRRSRVGVARGLFAGVFLALALASFSFLFRQKLTVFPAAPSKAYVASTQPKMQLVAFVGVQTGFTKKNASPGSVYEKRRKLLRETWFPSPKSALDKFEEENAIRVRFVIGHTSDEAAERKVRAEQEEHDDFVRIDFEENYKNLALKTLMFLRYVVDNFDVQYIVKADDDVFLALPRLRLAAPQWKERDADYIGCMVRSTVLWDAKNRWYEPQHALVGRNYFAYALGSLYVLSGQAAVTIRHIPEGKLRFFNNEDTTVGGWMVALNVTHFDDRRLCASSCQVHTLALFSGYCAGLCSPFTKMPLLHNNRECQTLHDPLPLLAEKLPVSGARSRLIHQTKNENTSE